MRAAAGRCDAQAARSRSRRSYKVDIDAPRSVRSLLKTIWTLSRFAKRDDISDDQFDFLVTATPQEVRDLVATEGYFTPVVRTDVQTVDDKKSVTVSVDPGPQTTVASVSLTFRAPVTDRRPGAGKHRALRVFAAAKAIRSRRAPGTTRKTRR